MIIDEDDLGYDEDCDDIYVYNDIPFTGTAVHRHENGCIARVTNYLDGLMHGDYIEYYESGLIKRQCQMNCGIIDKQSTIWHSNGCVKSVANYNLGVEMSYDEWNETGTQLLSRQIDAGSELYTYATSR